MVKVNQNIDNLNKTYQQFVITDLQEKMKDVFVDVISETVFFEDNNVWVTEKTVTPITLGLPFIISSTSGIYELLHYLGFKTFSDFWDESFDAETDHIERNKKFLNTLDYIAETYNTEEKRKEAYKKMLPILEHNRQRMIYFFENPREVLGYIKHTDKAIAELESILKSAYPNS